MYTRKSSGCVVFRETRKGNVEVLLVTSSDGKNWVLPKGGVEPYYDERSSARLEVMEEAGVHCKVGIELGRYRYVKNDMMNEVIMFAASYTGDAEEWKEESKRERKWFKAEKAAEKLDQYLAAFVYDVVNMVEANNRHEQAKIDRLLAK